MGKEVVSATTGLVEEEEAGGIGEGGEGRLDGEPGVVMRFDILGSSGKGGAMALEEERVIGGFKEVAKKVGGLLEHGESATIFLEDGEAAGIFPEGGEAAGIFTEVTREVARMSSAEVLGLGVAREGCRSARMYLGSSRLEEEEDGEIGQQGDGFLGGGFSEETGQQGDGFSEETRQQGGGLQLERGLEDDSEHEGEDRETALTTPSQGAVSFTRSLPSPAGVCSTATHTLSPTKSGDIAAPARGSLSKGKAKVAGGSAITKTADVKALAQAHILSLKEKAQASGAVVLEGVKGKRKGLRSNLAL